MFQLLFQSIQKPDARSAINKAQVEIGSTRSSSKQEKRVADKTIEVKRRKEQKVRRILTMGLNRLVLVIAVFCVVNSQAFHMGNGQTGKRLFKVTALFDNKKTICFDISGESKDGADHEMRGHSHPLDHRVRIRS